VPSPAVREESPLLSEPPDRVIFFAFPEGGSVCLPPFHVGRLFSQRYVSLQTLIFSSKENLAHLCAFLGGDFFEEGLSFWRKELVLRTTLPVGDLRFFPGGRRSPSSTAAPREPWGFAFPPKRKGLFFCETADLRNLLIFSLGCSSAGLQGCGPFPFDLTLSFFLSFHTSPSEIIVFS